MDWEEDARKTDRKIKAIIEAFALGQEPSEMLNRVNVEDKVNTWMHCLEPFQIDDDYYLLIPIINYFHFGEDLLDYHERDFLQGKSDREKVLTVNKMSPSKEEYESYTCIERSQTDGAILSVEVNSHGQNGLHFDKLSVFKSEAALIDHYKNMMYDPVGNQLTPIEGHFITDGEKIISHSELDLIKFFDRYIEPRLETT